MLEPIEYSFRSGGFGILIMEISMLLHTGRPLRCWVPTADHPLISLKQIWQIDDSRMTIQVEDRGWHPASNDMIKAFSPYHEADQVLLFGQRYSTARPGRPCIGLAQHAHGLGEEKTVKHSPYHKFATREIYDQIAHLCDRAGYDVITINQPALSVEHKAWILTELCACVIGYEGGVMHLAHTLRVPTIILPWRFHGDGSEITDPQDEINWVAHSYHMDRRTWFPETQEEICGWSATDLEDCIQRLRQGQGNNRYYEPGVLVDLENLRFEGSVINDPFNTGQLSTTREFIRKYNPAPGIY